MLKDIDLFGIFFTGLFNGLWMVKELIIIATIILVAKILWKKYKRKNK